MRLHPAAAAAGLGLIECESLPSTNAEALQRARSGETRPLWIVAKEQTAGRGRRGNAWISQPGNLHATLLLTDPSAAEVAAQVSFVAAVAVHDAVSDCAPALGGTLALKWPNDLLCGDRKISGILIEAETVQRRLAVAVGIGVNCRHHPPHTSYPATDLFTAGADLSAETLFTALSGAMQRRLVEWGGGAGFSVVRAAWLERTCGLDGDLRVKLPDRELVGHCEGLDADGRLLLRLADGRCEAIAAGEVYSIGTHDRRSATAGSVM